MGSWACWRVGSHQYAHQPVLTCVDARFGRARIFWVGAGGSKSVTTTEHGDLYTCGKAEQVCHTHQCPARTTQQHGGAHARCLALDAACARWVLPQPATPPRPRLCYGKPRVPGSHCAHSLSIFTDSDACRVGDSPEQGLRICFDEVWELVQRIVEACVSRPLGRAGELEGMVPTLSGTSLRVHTLKCADTYTPTNT